MRIVGWELMVGEEQDFNEVQFLIINCMKQQLQRIRAKDFSSIDDTLFENLSRADNLTSTISQLSEFQKFLLEQINSLNHDPTSASSNIIAKSIAKNINGLKDSLVRCSKIQEKAERTDKKAVIALKAQVDSLKKDMKNLQSEVKKSLKANFNHNSMMFEGYSKGMIQKLQKQRTKNNQIQQAFKLLEAENMKLKAENEYLKKSKQPIQHCQQNISVPMILQRHQPRQRKPLQQCSHNSLNDNYKLKYDSWKACKDQSSNYLATQSDKRSNSLKRQTSNHQISRKSNFQILREQQDQLLRGKGVQVEQLKRGKSKQKIKLASMF